VVEDINLLKLIFQNPVDLDCILFRALQGQWKYSHFNEFRVISFETRKPKSLESHLMLTSDFFLLMFRSR